MNSSKLIFKVIVSDDPLFYEEDKLSEEIKKDLVLEIFVPRKNTKCLSNINLNTLLFTL